MERRRLIDDGDSPSSYIKDRLTERVIGQDAAIEAITTAFEKARLRDERRPVASMMFLGPTGVGKTELATSLSEILAPDKLHPNLLRIDCAQYAQGHEVANLVGAPPGYVGREQAPALDPSIIEMPGSVVLFDEIEKGHPKLWNYLLQIMEGGTVKLMNGGDEVNFSNATVIMTSNVGAREMQDALKDNRIGFGVGSEVDNTKVETAAFNALKKQFSPEFINRLDGVITFKSLDDDQLVRVLDTHVERSNHRYRRLGNVAISLSEALKAHLVETAELRREFGARPVLRNYERSVESKLSRFVAKQLIGGSEIEVDYENDEVTFYEGRPMGGSTIEEILGVSEEDFFVDEPECEDDEFEKLPANVTPISRKKK